MNPLVWLVVVCCDTEPVLARSLYFGLLVVSAVGVLVVSVASAAASGGPLGHLARAPAGIDVVAYVGSERLYATGRALVRLEPNGRLVRVARLRGVAIQIETSSTVVALIEQRGSARRLLAGPPTGPLRVLARCRGPRREIPYSPLAVAGSAVAEALSCKRARGIYNGAASFRVHDANAVRTVHASPGERVIALAGAPGMLATATQAKSLDGPVRVEVTDPATAALRYAAIRVPEPAFAEPLAVQADGVAVFCGPRERLAWASPDAPSAHLIPRAECSPFDVSIAEGRIAYHDQRADALRVTDLLGRRRTLLQPAGAIPFAWNGGRLLVRGLGCGEDFLGEIALAAAPYRGPICHVRIAAVTRGRGRGTVRVALACRPGCRGALELTIGRGQTPRRPALYRLLRRGRQTVRIRLTRHERDLLLHYRRVPFFVSTIYTNAADGGTSERILERSGTLLGDGPRRFPPPPPPPPQG